MGRIAILVAALTSNAVSAQTSSYRFDLRGSEQVPRNPSGASGGGFLQLDPVRLRN